MNIGIDIDNVISKFDEAVEEEFLKHDKELRNTGIIDPNKHMTEGMFDWSEEELWPFYLDNVERIAKTLEVKEGAREYIEKLKEALEYYSVKDIDYHEKCNRCIDEINNNKKIYDKTNEIYEILYIDKTEKFRELWEEKNINILFGQNVNPFITSVLLLLGFEYHKKNISKYNFDNEQIEIQKQRVKEFLINNGTIYEGYGELKE